MSGKMRRIGNFFNVTSLSNFENLMKKLYIQDIECSGRCPCPPFLNFCPKCIWEDLDPVCDDRGRWGPYRSYPNECTAKCNGGVCLNLTITDCSVLVRVGAMDAAALVNLGQWVHAPIISQICVLHLNSLFSYKLVTSIN